MKYHHTEAFIVFWLLVLCIYAFIAARYFPEAAISEVMNTTIRKHPIVGVVFGMVMGIVIGHIWWPIHPE